MEITITNDLIYDKVENMKMNVFHNCEVSQFTNNNNLINKSHPDEDTSFIALLKRLPTEEIFISLKRICTFLQSSKHSKELCLPFITSDMQMFIRMIVENTNYLKCSYFDNVCTVLCQKIIRILQDPKCLYKIIYKFWSGPISKDLLILLKWNFCDEKDKDISVSSHTYTGFHSSRQQTWINTILKFVKKPLRNELKFTLLPLHFAEYIHLLVQGKNDIEGVDQKLFKPLCEALSESRFSIEVKYHRTRSDFINLTLVKVPKIKPTKREANNNNELKVSLMEQFNKFLENEKLKSAKATKIEPPMEKKKSSNTGGALNDRKAKLLQDMSTPVVNDKAMRMMLDMGWQGGALGVRGEGIVEPIIPAIGLVNRAGLGHVTNKQPNKNKTKSDTQTHKLKRQDKKADLLSFRLYFLDSILSLLLTSEKEKVITADKINKKMRLFLINTVKKINKKQKFDFYHEEEAEIVNKIYKCMKIDTDIKLSAIFDNLSRIVIMKFENMSIDNEDFWESQVSNLTQTEFVDDAKIQMLIDCIIIPNGTLCRSRKVIGKQAFRILILSHLLNLLKNNHVEQKLIFSKELLSKEIRYVQNIIHIRYLTPPTRLEVNIYKHILEYIGEFDVEVNFANDLKSLVLRKFIKSSQAKPELQYKSQTNPILRYEADTKSALQYEAENANIHRLLEIKKIDEKVIAHKVAVANYANASTSGIQSNANYEYSTLDLNGDPSFSKKGNEDSNGGIALDAVSDAHASGTKYYNRIPSEAVGYNDDVTDSSDEDLDDFSNSDTDTKISKDSNSDVTIEESRVSHITIGSDSSHEKFLNSSFESWIEESEADIDPKSKRNEDENLAKISVTVESTENITIKRVKSNSMTSLDHWDKKLKLECSKYVSMTPLDSSNGMDYDLVKKIQTLIMNKMVKTEWLPLIKCHGVKDGALKYSCHTEKSFAWFLNTVGVAADIKITCDQNSDLVMLFEVCAKVNSFIDISSSKILQTLELLNPGLKTNGWRVIKKEDFGAYKLCYFEIDHKSLQYLQSCCFSLFVGFDQADFNVIWH